MGLTPRWCRGRSAPLQIVGPMPRQMSVRRRRPSVRGGSLRCCALGWSWSALLRGALNGAHDAWIGSAAADIGTHMRDDLVAIGPRILRQQIGRAHDLAGLAIATLRHSLGEPGLLHRMGRILRQPLDGGDRLAGDLGHPGLAREGAFAVDMDHASTAEAGPTTEFGAGEFEFLAD